MQNYRKNAKQIQVNGETFCTIVSSISMKRQLEEGEGKVVPDIMALIIIAVTVGFGLLIIARQEMGNDGTEQDPSSMP